MWPIAVVGDFKEVANSHARRRPDTVRFSRKWRGRNRQKARLTPVTPRGVMLAQDRRVAFLMEVDVAPYRVRVRFFRPRTVMFPAYCLADQFQQLRLA